MKLTKDYLKKLINETLEEVSDNTGTASDDVTAGRESEPTEEEMGKTVYVLFEENNYSKGSIIYGVFDSVDAANSAGDELVERGAAETFQVISFNMNQTDEDGGIKAD